MIRKIKSQIGKPSEIREPQEVDDNGPVYQGNKPLIYMGTRNKELSGGVKITKSVYILAAEVKDGTDYVTGEEYDGQDIVKEVIGLNSSDCVGDLEYVRKKEITDAVWAGAYIAQKIHGERMEASEVVVHNGQLNQNFGPYTVIHRPNEKPTHLEGPLEQKLENAFLQGLKSASQRQPKNAPRTNSQL